MGTPYKMKGSPMQRNFGIGSPVKLTDAEKRANLLKAVPDEDAFNKLTPEQQRAFTKAGKAVGFPTKRTSSVPIRKDISLRRAKKISEFNALNLGSKENPLPPMEDL